MSDSIRPISYNPPIRQVKKKEDSGSRKDRRKEEKEFLDLVGKDKVNLKAQIKSDLKEENTDNVMEANKDSQEDKDSDNTSGTILDVEV